MPFRFLRRLTLNASSFSLTAFFFICKLNELCLKSNVFIADQRLLLFGQAFSIFFFGYETLLRAACCVPLDICRRSLLAYFTFVISIFDRQLQFLQSFWAACNRMKKSERRQRQAHQLDLCCNPHALVLQFILQFTWQSNYFSTAVTRVCTHIHMYGWKCKWESNQVIWEFYVWQMCVHTYIHTYVHSHTDMHMQARISKYQQTVNNIAGRSPAANATGHIYNISAAI